MLAVGLISSHLASHIAEQNEAILSKERETSMLYQLARDLGAALTLEQVVDIVGRFLRVIEMDSAVLIDEGSEGQEALTIHGTLPIGDEARVLPLRRIDRTPPSTTQTVCSCRSPARRARVAFSPWPGRAACAAATR
jgi:K+-sensing histidine kinase KdpD